MERYEKFVIEAERGIRFEVSEGTSGELIIRAEKSTSTIYSDNYVNPPIPKGYKHVCGGWNDGFVIEKIFGGSQFVWIPVGSLDSNGTLDGKEFSEKFGRRYFMGEYDKYRGLSFKEDFNYEFIQQFDSVKKYGGFYISRYNISKSPTGKPRSVKGAMPWVNLEIFEAEKIASTMEDSRAALKSHLVYGAEFDSVLEWFIKTKAKSLVEIVEKSNKLGNYNTGEIAVTGSREEWCINNIYDFAGNVFEWTQEKKYSSDPVTRGGSYKEDGDKYPVSSRENDRLFGRDDIGFRVALSIE